jgi:XTP/dITP diphosphohydrolase
VVAITAPDGREATTEGTVEGFLLETPRGAGGFGYDPIFYYPPFDATFAEVSPTAKHAVSHRGRAMAAARRVLRGWAS